MVPLEPKQRIIVVGIGVALLVGTAYLLWPSRVNPTTTVTQTTVPSNTKPSQVTVDNGLTYFEQNAAILPKETDNFKIAMLAFCKSTNTSISDVSIDSGSIHMLPMEDPRTDTFNTTAFTMHVNKIPYSGKLLTFGQSQIHLLIYNSTGKTLMYDSGIVNQST